MLSHPGRVRHGNEDACAAAPEAGAFVVCDGMGGAGRRRSSEPSCGRNLPCASRPSRLDGNAPDKPETRLNAAIRAANPGRLPAVAAFAKAGRHGNDPCRPAARPIVNGTGKRRTPSDHTNSRLTDPPTLWLGHVGDSRCYRLRRGKLEHLTHDHSLVEEQLRAGQITAAQAARSPMRNLITRAIGSQATVEPEIQSHRPQPNDVYLLASDGLTHEISDEEIVRRSLRPFPSRPRRPPSQRVRGAHRRRQSQRRQ